VSRAFSALLVSCYELGRQPFNLASPWAQLEAEGIVVSGVDTAIEPLDDDAITAVELVAISVPMHTALRLGCEVARRIRAVSASAHICFFGMYASLNAELLLREHADSVIGGEFEVALVELAQSLRDGGDGSAVSGVITERTAGQSRDEDGVTTLGAPPVLRKLPFVVPRRDRLPPLRRYATFHGPREGETRQLGYVEATRGCLHHCRHCPVTPVYQGRFFVVPREIVLADATQQVAAGAGHLSFGDPDFFNGPKHGMEIVRALHAAHPDVSFDVTIKIEHLLANPQYVHELGTLGCAFIITAVESLSDVVLARLSKGHTRADIDAVLASSRLAQVPLRPSLIPFTPWATLDDYLELTDWVMREGLADHLEPIQLAIRLLIPPGSAILWDRARSDDSAHWLRGQDDAAFGYRWEHPDPRMDTLHKEISALVEDRVDDDAAEVVQAIRTLAYRLAERDIPFIDPPSRRFVPRTSESWVCCAEPTARQLSKVATIS